MLCFGSQAYSSQWRWAEEVRNRHFRGKMGLLSPFSGLLASLRIIVRWTPEFVSRLLGPSQKVGAERGAQQA